MQLWGTILVWSQVIASRDTKNVSPQARRTVLVDVRCDMTASTIFQTNLMDSVHKFSLYDTNLKHMLVNNHELITNKSNRNTKMLCCQTLFSVTTSDHTNLTNLSDHTTVCQPGVIFHLDINDHTTISQTVFFKTRSVMGFLKPGLWDRGMITDV